MKGVTPVVVILLLLLITLGVATAYWLFTKGLQTAAQKQAEEGTSETTQATRTFLAIDHITGNQVFVRNGGGQTISRMALYLDGIPIVPMQTPATLAAGQLGTILLPYSLDFGEHRVRVVGNAKSTDTTDLIGNILDFKWKRQITVKNPTTNDYSNVWAKGAKGISINVTRPLGIDAFAVFDDQNIEIPSVIRSNWWDGNWQSRRAITFRERAGAARANEQVTVRLTDVKGECNQLRVTDFDGVEVPTQLVSADNSTCDLLMMADIPGNGTRTYYVYDSNFGAGSSAYATDLTKTENSTDVCIENSQIKLCADKGADASIKFLSTTVEGKGKNLLQVRVGERDGYRTGIQPRAVYPHGKDSDVCGRYTYVGHKFLVDGPVKKVLQYDFKVECPDFTVYNYRYEITVYSGQSSYDLRLENPTQLALGEGSTNLLQTWWVYGPPNFNSVPGQWAAQWDKGKTNAAGVIVKELSSRLVVDSLRPTQSLLVAGTTPLSPGVISDTRTILYSSEAGESETVNAYVRYKNPIEYTIGTVETKPPATQVSVDFVIGQIGKEETKKYWLYYTDEKFRKGQYVINGVTETGGFQITLKNEEDFVQQQVNVSK